MRDSNTSTDDWVMLDEEATKPRWRVRRKGETDSYGPYTEVQLKEYLREGRIQPRDFVTDGHRTVFVEDLLGPSSTPPPPPPLPHAPPTARYGTGANTSGQDVEPPLEVKNMGFSWGAFGLGLIWVIANRVWMPGLLVLLAFVPYLGWLWSVGFGVYMGIHGHKLAWRNREFQSVQQFKDTMAVWNNWAIGLLIVAGIVGLLAGVARV